MQVIILGAGRVGSTLAENLSKESHDVTVVDVRADWLQQMQDRLDIRTILGHASYPNVLRDAGGETADMIIAVTDVDEINMMACQVAHSLFDIPKKIARVRSQHYFSEQKLFGDENMPVDVFISPEHLVIQHIKELINYPGALQVIGFANNTLKLVGMKPFYGGQLLGRSLSKIPDVLPDIDMRVVAIFRKDQSIPVDSDTEVEIEDEVFFIAPTQHVQKVMSAFRKLDKPYNNIMIAGGGNIGSGLAHQLEKEYQIKLIEQSADRCQYLSETLTHTTVLNGSATDRELMIAENIEHMDLYCAMTNDDEDNILSCMLAKRYGVRQSMALINRPGYVDLMENMNINIAISPDQATTSSILAHIRSDDVVNVHTLRRGAAEVIEAIARGAETTSKVVGRSISQLKLPKGIIVGALVREEAFIIPKDDTVIEAQDHVVMFVADKKLVPQVEGLFKVKI